MNSSSVIQSRNRAVKATGGKPLSIAQARTGHARRYFAEAEPSDPRVVEALAFILTGCPQFTAVTEADVRRATKAGDVSGAVARLDASGA